MALPTETEQRSADIDLTYDPDLPWVRSASISGESCYVRFMYGPNPAWAEVDEAFARAEAGCFVRVVDLSEPTRRQVITIDGVDWTVTSSARANDWEWRLTLEDDVKVTF
jgi:hypothetical protein